MSHLKLWCWKFCPYAQRAWVSFLKCDLEFEYNEINPYENRKNKLWREISPEGKVPVIQINNQVPGINESLTNMKMINELSNYKLTSLDSIKDEKIRQKAEMYDKLVVNSWYGYLMGSIGKNEFTDGLKQFLQEFSISDTEPYFDASSTLGFVDIARVSRPNFCSQRQR